MSRNLVTTREGHPGDDYLNVLMIFLFKHAVCFGYLTSLGCTVSTFRRRWKWWPGIFPWLERDIANIPKPLALRVQGSIDAQCLGRHYQYFMTIRQPYGEVAQWAKYPQGRSSHKAKSLECFTHWLQLSQPQYYHILISNYHVEL